eukprot:SAG22_NODE_15672_length_343_cov_1.331967_1_plen_40_part_01
MRSKRGAGGGGGSQVDMEFSNPVQDAIGIFESDTGTAAGS